MRVKAIESRPATVPDEHSRRYRAVRMLAAPRARDHVSVGALGVRAMVPSQIRNQFKDVECFEIAREFACTRCVVRRLFRLFRLKVAESSRELSPTPLRNLSVNFPFVPGACLVKRRTGYNVSGACEKQLTDDLGAYPFVDEFVRFGVLTLDRIDIFYAEMNVYPADGALSRQRLHARSGLRQELLHTFSLVAF